MVISKAVYILGSTPTKNVSSRSDTHKKMANAATKLIVFINFLPVSAILMTTYDILVCTKSQNCVKTRQIGDRGLEKKAQ